MRLVKTLPAQGKWPCLFTASDTTGEKDNENLGIIKNESTIKNYKEFFTMIPDFGPVNILM